MTDMAEPLVLSGSSVSTYQTCPKKWYYEYVERRERPPRLKLARGLAAHEAIESTLAHRVRTWEYLPTEEVVERYLQLFDEYAHESPEVQGRDKKPDIRNRGMLAVQAWCENVAPSVDPLYVEVNGQFKLGGVDYNWTADLVDSDHVVRDWKFSAKKPGRDSRYGPDYTLPMQGYAIGMRHKTGTEESGIRLDFMVCTLDPYLVSDESPPLTQEDIDEFRDTIVEVHDRITEGQFPPLGLDNRACSWCPYSDGTCEPHRRQTLDDERRRAAEQDDY